MKRDWNLERQILMQLEQTTATDGNGFPKLELPDRTNAEISYHIKLMHGDGLIDAHDVASQTTPIGEYAWKATGLTSKGHGFLDNVRDESVWKQVLAKVGGTFAAATVSVIAELALQFTREKLGLPR